MDELFKAIAMAISKADSGEVLISVMTVGGILVLGTLYIYKVAVPQAATHRNAVSELVKATAAIIPVVADIHEVSTDTNVRMRCIHGAMRGPVMGALKKINDSNPDIDLDEEIGELKGCLNGADA